MNAPSPMLPPDTRTAEPAFTVALDREPRRIDPASLPDGHLAVDVLDVEHWTDTLFSFRVTRPDSLRFRSGEFLMIGLPGEHDRPLMRAYSIASPVWEEHLEFYSIKVQHGPLTSRLQHIAPGDQLLLKPKPVGTLLLEALRPAPALWMVATGTGVAPFASLLRDPDTYERFETVVLVHTCRTRGELAFGQRLIDELGDDPLIGEAASRAVVHAPTTTRETTARNGRCTDLIRTGELFAELGLPVWSPERDRVMICGSLAMNRETAELCKAAGLVHGSSSKPGDYVTEKAFVG